MENTYVEKADAIAAYRIGVDNAKKLLPSGINETQRRAVLNCALAGLSDADLPYYRRAINLLMGQTDVAYKKRGDWVIKKMVRGQIRRRGPDKTIIVQVSAT